MSKLRFSIQMKMKGDYSCQNHQGKTFIEKLTYCIMNLFQMTWNKVQESYMDYLYDAFFVLFVV